jgi:RNA polymerase sigma factor (sigma-70 family)
MIGHQATDDVRTDAEVIWESLERPASFARVFERHFVPVHRYLSQRLGPDLADELGAQSFLVAFDGRASYDLDRPDARPWLLGIAANLIHRHWRAERRWLKACGRVAVQLTEEEPQVLDRQPVATLDEGLASSLRRLARRDRETLLLFAWAELSYEEIALALGIPLGTVRSRINRARRQMRETLGPSCDPPAEPLAAAQSIGDKRRRLP